MKLVYVNVNPYKKFNKEKAVLIKLQIDNSLDLGWKAEDIILLTNFDYEYRGVKSTIVSDDNYCAIDDNRYAFKVSSHIFTMTSMLEKGFFKDNVRYWYHDIDAYQEHEITEEELGLEGIEIGMTDYGYSPKWNLGSFFFKNTITDMFQTLRQRIIDLKIPDERSMTSLVKEGHFKGRYKRLNITYNFGMKHIEYNYKIATKPLKVLHFHPIYHDKTIYDTTLNMFMYGKNPINKVLMTDRLIKLFHKYGYIKCDKTSYGEFLDYIGYD